MNSEIMCVHNFDFKTMQKGYRFAAITYCGKQKRILQYEFLRLNRNTQEPIFRCLDTGKTITRIMFCDFTDIANVAALHDVLAKEIKADEERSARYQKEANERRERQRLEYQARAIELDKEYTSQAEKLGLSLDEFKEALSRWHEMQRSIYTPNRCFMCGRHLVDPVSILKGIGPECIQRVDVALRVAVSMNLLNEARWKYREEAFIKKLRQAGLEESLREIEQASSSVS